MKCENCKEKHNGEYGSGRFCSPKCARGFSTKIKRKEINEKVSDKLKGKPQPHCKGNADRIPLEARRRGGVNGAKTKKEKYKLKCQKLYEEEKYDLLCKKNGTLKNFYKDKILEEQNYKCNICNNDKWLEKPIVLEIHHKDGDKYNNHRSNIERLCPNCHSQTDNWKTRGGMNKY